MSLGEWLCQCVQPERSSSRECGVWCGLHTSKCMETALFPSLPAASRSHCKKLHQATSYALFPDATRGSPDSTSPPRRARGTQRMSRVSLKRSPLQFCHTTFRCCATVQSAAMT